MHSYMHRQDQPKEQLQQQRQHWQPGGKDQHSQYPHSSEGTTPMFHPKHPQSVRVNKRTSSFRFSKRWTTDKCSTSHRSSTISNSTSSVTSVTSEAGTINGSVSSRLITTANTKSTTNESSNASSNTNNKSCFVNRVVNSPKRSKMHINRTSMENIDYNALDDGKTTSDCKDIGDCGSATTGSSSGKGAGATISSRFHLKRKNRGHEGAGGNILVRGSSDTTSESSNPSSSPESGRSVSKKYLPPIEHQQEEQQPHQPHPQGEGNHEGQMQQQQQILQEYNSNDIGTCPAPSCPGCSMEPSLPSINILHPLNDIGTPLHQESSHSMTCGVDNDNTTKPRRTTTSRPCVAKVERSSSSSSIVPLGGIRSNNNDSKKISPCDSNYTCTSEPSNIASTGNNASLTLNDLNSCTGPVDVDSVLDDELADLECRIVARNHLLLTVSNMPPNVLPTNDSSCCSSQQQEEQQEFNHKLMSVTTDDKNCDMKLKKIEQKNQKNHPDHNCHRRSKLHETDDIVSIYGASSSRTIISDKPWPVNTNSSPNVLIGEEYGEKKSLKDSRRTLRKAKLVRNDTGAYSAIIPSKKTAATTKKTLFKGTNCSCSIHSAGSSSSGPVDVDSVYELYPNDDDSGDIFPTAPFAENMTSLNYDYNHNNIPERITSNAGHDDSNDCNDSNGSLPVALTTPARTTALQRFGNQLTTLTGLASTATPSFLSFLLKSTPTSMEVPQDNHQQKQKSSQYSLPTWMLISPSSSPSIAPGEIFAAEHVRDNNGKDDSMTITESGYMKHSVVDDGPVDVDDYIVMDTGVGTNRMSSDFSGDVDTDDPLFLLDEIEYSRILAGYEIGFEVETIWDYEMYKSSKDKRHKGNKLQFQQFGSSSSIPYPIYEQDDEDGIDDDDVDHNDDKEDEEVMEVAKRMEMGLVIMSRHRTFSDKASI